MAGGVRTLAAMLGALLALSFAAPTEASAAHRRRPRSAPTITVTTDRVAIQPRAQPVRFTVTSSDDAPVTVTVAHGGDGPDVTTLADHEAVLAEVPLVL